MAYNLHLHFIDQRENKFPLGRIARIYVTGTERHGLRFITPECLNIEQLEGQIEILHQELEDIRKEAKIKLGK